MIFYKLLLITCIICSNHGLDFFPLANDANNQDNELMLHNFTLSCVDYWKLNRLKIFFNEGSGQTKKLFLKLSDLHLQASIHFGFQAEKAIDLFQRDYISTSVFVFANNTIVSQVLEILLDFKLRNQRHIIFLVCLDCNEPLDLREGHDFISRIIIGVPNKFGFQLHELNYEYAVRRLTITVIGVWHNVTGLHITRQLSNSEYTFQNATLNVLNRHILPYGTSYNHSVGNFVPKSYIGSVFRSLSAVLNFSYNIHNSTAGYYGEIQANGSFNGLIGEFINNKFDLALGIFSSTPTRRKVVDYTAPFFKEGVGFAAHSSNKLSGKTWTLLASLFKEQLWLGIVLISILLAISIGISILWGYPRTTKEFDPIPILLATWLQKGSEDDVSNAVSSKITISTAYIFFWFIVGIYNAVLVTFLTLETGIIMSSFEELANSEYAVEAIRASNVVEMLKASKNLPLQSLSKKIRKVHSYAEGLNAVCNKNNQAFLAPVTYFITLKRRQCKFYIIKELLTIDYYYFITQKHSILNRRISKALTKLQEAGVLLRLSTLYNLKLLPTMNQDTKSSEVSLNQIIGPFLILLAGTVLAFLLLVVEIIYHRVKTVQHKHFMVKKFNYK